MSAVVGLIRPATPENLAERFWRLVDSDGECWLWLGGRGGKGNAYGVFRNAERVHTSAHRIAYELTIGPIPSGLVLDHTCSVSLCVNPAHLEPVTAAENRRRQSQRITHCKNGHPLDGENLYIDRRGFRACRECRNTQAWRPPQSVEAWEKRKTRHREYMRERRRLCRPS